MNKGELGICGKCANYSEKKCLHPSPSLFISDNCVACSEFESSDQTDEIFEQLEEFYGSIFDFYYLGEKSLSYELCSDYADEFCVGSVMLNKFSGDADILQAVSSVLSSFENLSISVEWVVSFVRTQCDYLFAPLSSAVVLPNTVVVVCFDLDGGVCFSNSFSAGTPVRLLVQMMRLEGRGSVHLVISEKQTSKISISLISSPEFEAYCEGIVRSI